METRRYTIVLPDGTRQGPYTWSHLKALAQSSEIVPTTTILDGLRGETTAMDVPGVFEQPHADLPQSRDMSSWDVLAAALCATSFALSFGLAYFVWANASHSSSTDSSIIYSYYGSPQLLATRFSVLILGLVAAVGIGQGKRWGFGLHTALRFGGSYLLVNSIPLPWPWWNTVENVIGLMAISYSVLRLLGCFGELPKS